MDAILLQADEVLVKPDAPEDLVRWYDRGWRMRGLRREQTGSACFNPGA